MPVDFVASALSSATRGPVSDSYIQVKHWFAALDPGGTKLKDYRDGLLSAFGTIQIMGMVSARKLETLYIALRVLPNLKKHTQIIEHSQIKKKSERSIVGARQLLDRREQLNIDKFIRELG